MEEEAAAGVDMAVEAVDMEGAEGAEVTGEAAADMGVVVAEAMIATTAVDTEETADTAAAAAVVRLAGGAGGAGAGAGAVEEAGAAPPGGRMQNLEGERRDASRFPCCNVEP